MDVSTEPNQSWFSGEMGGPGWISHARLRRVNVGYVDGSVKDFDAYEVTFKSPTGLKELLNWFDEANKRY
jgi:prepilin-type processing-associated H-X9-DG protein